MFVLNLHKQEKIANFHEEGKKLAIIGGGQPSSFIHLFQAHPFVEEVGLVELNPERRASISAKFLD
jgi:spermidine synthase